MDSRSLKVFKQLFAYNSLSQWFRDFEFELTPNLHCSIIESIYINLESLSEFVLKKGNK